VGAYVADAHLGRYNTIVVSIFIALVGHTLLVISAIPAVIVHPNGSFACFIVAIIVSLLLLLPFLHPGGGGTTIHPQQTQRATC
jgi:dipeptide/tripeptide permease